MKFINKSFFVLAVAFLFFGNIANAAGLVPCEGLNCTSLCQLGQMIERIINYAIRISFVIATIFIIYGGLKILVAGANPGLVASGRKTILNAVIGVAITLGAWLIIGTVLKFLVGGTEILPELGPWNTIQCS